MNIEDTTRIRWGRLIAGFAVTVGLTSMGILAVLGRWDFLIETFAVHNGLIAVGFGSLAWVTISTQARNRAVWALAWSAFFGALFTAGVAVFVLWAQASIPNLDLDAVSGLSPSELPFLVAIALQPVAWAWIPAFMLVLTLGLLLFPDGRPPSPRWRWVGWYSVATITLSVAPLAWLARPSSTVPIDGTVEGQQAAAAQIAEGALGLVLVGAVMSTAALVVRYRRSSGVTRRQIRWIAWGGAFLVTTLAVDSLVEAFTGTTAEALSVSSFLTIAGEALLILSFAVAITKYRLYDIDVVISRTVTYGALAVAITALYVAIVVGIGSLVGQGDEPNLALAIGATALVAILFEPLRSRLQRWANRLVYGRRATPYEVLSESTARLSEAESSEQALERLAELVGRGTGAVQAVVWLRVADRLLPVAVSPAAERAPVDLVEGELPAVLDDALEATLYRGDLIGAVSISKDRAEPVTPADRRLLKDVAGGAGLLLRNVSLNEALADRAEELRTSRRRLIAAQDLERRKLERNLHDGAQQQVVALKVKLGLARTLAEREGAAAIAEAVADLAEDSQRAVDGMRAAARGIYPPLLEAEGLAAALAAASREGSMGLRIAADGMNRYSPEIEATVYFSVLAALGSASSDNGGGEVELVEDDEGLTFSIRVPSGLGSGLSAVTDRLDALGGTLSVESAPDGGAVIVGRLPLAVMSRS